MCLSSAHDSVLPEVLPCLPVQKLKQKSIFLELIFFIGLTEFFDDDLLIFQAKISNVLRLF